MTEERPEKTRLRLDSNLYVLDTSWVALSTKRSHALGAGHIYFSLVCSFSAVHTHLSVNFAAKESRVL